MRNIKERFGAAGLGAQDFFAAFLACFVISSVVFAAGGDFRDLSYVRQYPIWLFATVFAAAALVIFVFLLVFQSKRVIKYTLFLSSVVYALLLCIRESENIFLNLGIALVLVYIIKYVLSEDEVFLKKELIGERASFLGTVGICIFLFLFIFFTTSAKYLGFNHGSFDFGIFAQMFEQMAKTGLPMTTVERSRELSHFAVHFSPVYYFFLPGYMIFRSPLYLLAIQGAMVALCVFPVRKIVLQLGMSPGEGFAAAAVFALYPTMANGCFYDFHENKFLTLFIFWAVYFVLRDKPLGVVIFSILILSVKEDAFIYVLAICLWIIVSTKRKWLGILLAVASILYFVFACAMIGFCGGEIMSSRFKDYELTAGGGLLEVARVFVTDIGYVIYQVFSGADTESFSEITYGGQKLEFLMWTAAPLMFTPFLSKKPSRLVLLVPMLVINLMPSWLYQFDIDYQYTYGTAALLIFAAFLCLSEHSRERRRFLLVCMMTLSLIFSVSVVTPKAARYVSRYYSSYQYYKESEKVLEQIPKDASVTAYGYIMPHLYYIDDMHSCPEYYGEYEMTDYYVIDTRYEHDRHSKKMIEAMGDDYELVCRGGCVKIYKLKSIVGEK